MLPTDPLSVVTREQLLLEIEAAHVRLAWAMSKTESDGETPAMAEYIKTAQEDLQTLQARYLKMFEGDLQ